MPALKKRGWSEAKINSWLHQKTANIERRQQAWERQAASTSPDLENWLELLRTVLHSGATTRVGLLVHFYSGAVVTERIAITRREEMSLSDLTPASLRAMDDDVLYEVRSTS